MKMEKIYAFGKQFILNPNQTFKKIASGKNDRKYFIYLVIFLLCYGFLNYLLFPPQTSEISHPSRTALAFHQAAAQITDFFHNYAVILPIFNWLFFGAILFLLIRLFSKKGSFASFLLAEGLITTLPGLVDLVFRWAKSYISFPIFNFLTFAVLIWEIYLGVLAVSIIFEISKKKAFWIQILYYSVIFILFMVYLISSVANNLKT